MSLIKVVPYVLWVTKMPSGQPGGPRKHPRSGYFLVETKGPCFYGFYWRNYGLQILKCTVGMSFLFLSQKKSSVSICDSNFKAALLVSVMRVIRQIINDDHHKRRLNDPEELHSIPAQRLIASLGLILPPLYTPFPPPSNMYVMDQGEYT